MDNKDVLKAVEKYDTPMYLYNEEKICQQIQILRDTLFPGFQLFYAMKANPLIGIIQLMKANGCGIETASMGEIKTAIHAGVDSKQIIFTSPGKTEQELSYAVDSDVKLINVESLEEAGIIQKLAEEKNKVVKIGIRINQNVNYSKAKMKMTGVSSQFGIDESDFTFDHYQKFKKYKNLEIVGIQVYSGTQVLDAEEILKNAEYVMQMAIRFSDEYGFKLRYLNLGGGFGVPYFKGEKDFDYAILKQGMIQLQEKYGPKLSETEIIFESGRFLMAESGLYITKVLYRKVSKGVVYYVCDGGSNFHSATAFMGRFVRNNFPIYSIPDDCEKIYVNVVGPLCTPADLMGQKIEMKEELKPGDLIIVDKSGAYGFTFSPYGFLSHETPIEVLKRKDGYVVLRERGVAEDFWNHQKGIKDGKI